MPRFDWASSDYKDAGFVVLGVPDETGSHSKRKGQSLAPDTIRKVSNERDTFDRMGKRTTFQAESSVLQKRVHDAGNIMRKGLKDRIASILKDGKMPVSIGGDHSVTRNVLEGVDEYMQEHGNGKEVSLVFLDAHPDFICSSKERYFGTIVCDAADYKSINIHKSAIAGIRAPEEEELKNIEKFKIASFTSLDFAEKGVYKILQEIDRKVGSNKVYLSIDMDVIDPAFAPGVSSPVPAGPASNQILFLCKKIAETMDLIGFDVMEVCPPYDLNDSTSHLAAKILLETIESCKRQA